VIACARVITIRFATAVTTAIVLAFVIAIVFACVIAIALVMTFAFVTELAIEFDLIHRVVSAIVFLRAEPTANGVLSPVKLS
jgi:hypothetical protein